MKQSIFWPARLKLFLNVGCVHLILYKLSEVLTNSIRNILLVIYLAITRPSTTQMGIFNFPSFPIL